MTEPTEPQKPLTAAPARREDELVSFLERLRQVFAAFGDRSEDFGDGDDASVLSALAKDPTVAATVSEALREGEMVPQFELPQADGTAVRLDDLLERGPVIVSFFHCERSTLCQGALKAWEETMPSALSIGASVMIVFPHAPLAAPASVLGEDTTQPERRGLFVVYDADHHVCQLFGLLFEVPPRFAKRLRHFAPEGQVGKGLRLPLTASYIVSEDGFVRRAFTAPDPSRCTRPTEVMAAFSTA